jgi:hypothetical protein
MGDESLIDGKERMNGKENWDKRRKLRDERG